MQADRRSGAQRFVLKSKFPSGALRCEWHSAARHTLGSSHSFLETQINRLASRFQSYNRPCSKTRRLRCGFNTCEAETKESTSQKEFAMDVDNWSQQFRSANFVACSMHVLTNDGVCWFRRIYVGITSSCSTYNVQTGCFAARGWAIICLCLLLPAQQQPIFDMPWKQRLH